MKAEEIWIEIKDIVHSRKNMSSIKKQLYSILTRLVYLCFAFFCFNLLKMVFDFLYDIMYIWVFVILLTIIQLSIPEFGDRIQKLTKIITDIFQIIVNLTEFIIETVVISFRKSVGVKEN